MAFSSIFICFCIFFTTRRSCQPGWQSQHCLCFGTALMKHITKHTGSVACQNGVFFSSFSHADLIFSSSACTRKFILLSFADAQVSISPLTFRDTRPAHQKIARSLGRSLGRSIDCSVDRSIARSIVRSLDRSMKRSMNRSLDRSIARSIVRSVPRSLGRSS